LGSTKVPTCITIYKRRFLTHIFTLNGGSRLNASIRKHGREHFHIYPLFEGITKEEIIEHEKLLIKALKAQHPDIGYNICKGGEGFTGPHTEEAKRKNSDASVKMWQRPGIRENFSAKMKGHEVSSKTVEKIKAARAVQDESRRVEGCRKYAEEHKDEMSTRMSREIHVMGGKAGSREAKQRAARVSVQGGSIVKAQHTRWHVNRGLTNPDCSLCPQFD
jgi:hypothetical protein